MANRFQSPSEQFEDTTGAPYAGGLLFFYITGTSTKTNTYSEPTLAVANSNPVVLDSAGRAGNIFLDPAVTYKVVLAAAGDTDPPGSPIITADPVVDPAANVTAAFQVYPGNPNGNVAGYQGAQGGTGASVVWDTVNNLLYVCTTTGTAATAVWTEVAATIAGAVAFSGTITPGGLGADQNDYTPTGVTAAYTVRLSASLAVKITGFAAAGDGRVMVLVNIGTFPITLLSQSASSLAANRFAFDGDVQLGPNAALGIEYDGTSARWRPSGKSNTGPLSAPGGRVTLITATPVMSVDVSAATTIYFTPNQGFHAPIYNGTSTVMVDLGSELSLALDSNAGHAGYHQTGKNFDLFLLKDTTGTVRFASGPAWTSDTVRSVAYAYKNGFRTNATSALMRYGSASGDTITIGVNEATLVGAFRASADGTTLWIASPAAAAGGGNARLYVSNLYNRVPLSATSRDSTDTWSHSSATWRASNAGGAGSGLNNRISALFVDNDQAVRATFNQPSDTSNGTGHFIGIGLDSITAWSGSPGATARSESATGSIGSTIASYSGMPGTGFHFFQCLEYAQGANSGALYGDQGNPLNVQMSIVLVGLF